MFSDTGVIKHYTLEGKEYCLLSQNGGLGKSGLWLRLYDMEKLDQGYIADYYSEGLNGKPETWMTTVPLYYAKTERFVLKQKPFSQPVCNPSETQEPCRDYPYTLERERVMNP